MAEIQQVSKKNTKDQAPLLIRSFADANSRRIVLQQIVPVTLISAIFTSLFYVWFYVQIDWRFLIPLAGNSVVIISAVAMLYFMRRDKLEIVAFLLLTGGILGYASLELAVSGATLFIALGGIALIFSSGLLSLPHRPYIWGGVAIIFGLYLWQINQAPPFVRYNFSQSDILTIYVYGVAVLPILALGALLFRIFSFGSIRIRLLIVLIGSVFFTATIVGVSSALLNLRNGQQQTISQLGILAELREDEIQNWLDNLSAIDLTAGSVNLANIQIILRQSPEDRISTIEGRIGQRIENILGRVVFENPDIQDVSIADDRGEVVLSTSPVLMGQVVRDELYFQNAHGALFFQPPVYLEEANQIKITISQAIFDTDGMLLGVIFGSVGVETLNDIMQQSNQFGGSVETYLVDENSMLLTEAYTNRLGSISVQSEAVNNAISEGMDGAGLYNDFRAVPVVGVYRWLDQLGIALVVEREQGEALQPIFVSLLTSLGIVILATALASFVGVSTTRTLTDPLRDLAATSTRVASGDLYLRAPVTRNDEVGEVAQAFNQMTEQLQGLIDSLEDRVTERTKALETTADISFQLTSLLDEDDILSYVVNRVHQQFDLYHTHIYLVDQNTNDLIMKYGYGDIGRKLKAEDHFLAAGQGIVGTVSETKQAFVSNNVDELLNFVRNKYLPNTKSEVAVPLRKGEEVLGVLDVQSERYDDFSDDVVSLLQSIADQTAVALDNAQQIERLEEAVDEVDRLNKQLLQQSWRDFEAETPTTGYRFSQGVSAAITEKEDTLLPPMKEAATKKQRITYNHAGNGDKAKSELAVPLLLHGEVIGVLGVKREDTPQWTDDEVSTVETVANQVAFALENARLSEEQGKTIVKLQEVDRLKSEFLTSMSHELRTPLNSIIGFADVIIQGIDGEVSDMAMNDVQLIYNSGQHLLALINDILDINKIEAGMMELVQEPLSIKDVVQDVLAATTALVKDKPVDVALDMNEDLPDINADKLRLNQILLNLVSNAVKFTKEGTITIRAKVVDDADFMRISVIDQGIGISEEKFSKIFDRFSQADMTTTREYGGTGLGLPICKQLIEMHGGTIDVKSEVGVGSEFFFTIPLVV